MTAEIEVTAGGHVTRSSRFIRKPGHLAGFSFFFGHSIMARHRLCQTNGV